MAPPPKGLEMGIMRRPPNAKVLIRAGYGIICELDDRPNELLKIPVPFEEFEKAHEIEKRAYCRLGKHRNLVRVVERDEWGIYFERASHGSLRDYYKEAGAATLEEKIKWCEDVAQVFDYVHRNNIRHSDLSGRNLLIDSSRNILLCDFAGSAIDDEKALVVAESGYRHPDETEYQKPTIRAEIHSLGSTIYEIVTGKQPHHGLEDQAVDRLIAEGQYPDVSAVPLGDVVMRCWKGGFNSAGEVAEEILISHSS